MEEIQNIIIMYKSMSIESIFTFLLVSITAYYAYVTNKILKQSKNEQKINFNEKTLEEFYYPLRSCLLNYSSVFYKMNKKYLEIEEEEEEEEEIEKRMIKNFYICFKKVIPYSYLASDDLKCLFNDFRMFYEIDKYNYINNEMNGTKHLEIEQIDKEYTSDTKKGEEIADEMIKEMKRNNGIFMEEINRILLEFDDDINSLRIDNISRNMDKFLDLYCKIIIQIDKDIPAIIKDINDLIGKKNYITNLKRSLDKKFRRVASK